MATAIRTPAIDEKVKLTVVKVLPVDIGMENCFQRVIFAHKIPFLIDSDHSAMNLERNKDRFPIGYNPT